MPGFDAKVLVAPARPRRREIVLRLGALGLVPSLLSKPLQAAAKPIRIGMTFDNSSVEKANGSGNHRGALAYFTALNKAGGIGGAQVELVAADDQFKPEVAKSNALAFLADPSILGMIAPLGTRQTAAIMESVTTMAIVGPNTGTAGLRKASPPNLFWVRASYDNEVEKLINTAATLGITRIGIVYPKDPLGNGVFAAFERSMAARNLKPTVVATTPGTTSAEVEPAAKIIAAAQPQVVVMVLAGVAPLFIKALRGLGSSATVYGLSISASAANIKALGEMGRGLGFAIIVPSPFSAKHKIVRQYQADMLAAGSNDFSLPTLEGYIDAVVLAEGLRRASPQLTRESLIAALEKIEDLDLGGIRVNYGRGNRLGSNFVDVAVIGAEGRIIA